MNQCTRELDAAYREDGLTTAHLRFALRDYIAFMESPEFRPQEGRCYVSRFQKGVCYYFAMTFRISTTAFKKYQTDIRYYPYVVNIPSKTYSEEEFVQSFLVRIEMLKWEIGLRKAELELQNSHN
jgi:hypothetical protein